MDIWIVVLAIISCLLIFLNCLLIYISKYLSVSERIVNIICMTSSCIAIIINIVLLFSPDNNDEKLWAFFPCFLTASFLVFVFVGFIYDKNHSNETQITTNETDINGQNEAEKKDNSNITGE